MTRAVGAALAVLGLALMVGGMVFFGAVVAPLVFTRLTPPGPFIRVLFPFYFGFVAASSALGALGFGLRRQMVSAAVLLGVLAAVLWAWLWLIPQLDAWRAAGDAVAFDRGHAVSTWLNGVELAAGVWLLVRLVVVPGRLRGGEPV